MMNKIHLLFLFFFLLVVPLTSFYIRQHHEFKIGTSWDPRDLKKLTAIQEQKAKDQFENYRRDKVVRYSAWPALKAMQVSFLWMDLLQSTHYPQSYQGNYSWVFARLQKIVALSPEAEIKHIASMAAFYFVLSDDWDGSTYFMQVLLQRAEQDWRIWFWCAFHALENLNDRKLAADLYLQAARRPNSPPYLLPLSVMLKSENQKVETKKMRAQVLSELEPALVDRLKEIKPEWFE